MTQGSAALSLIDAAQGDSSDSDLAWKGLVLLAQFHGIAAGAAQLAHQFGRVGEAFDETTLLLAAKQLGLKAKIIQQSVERVSMATLPALALAPDGEHFIVAKVSEDTVLIHDLAMQRPQVLTGEAFQARYAGRLLVVTSRASVLGELAKFDFRWFVPAVVKYRKLLLEVFIVLSKGVLGQVAKVTCVAPTTALPAGCGISGAIVSETTYDPTRAPVTTSSFGKLQQAMTYNAVGTVATVKDGNDNVTSLSSGKRGISQNTHDAAQPIAVNNAS